MNQQLCGHKTAENIFYFSLAFFTRINESVFSTVLCQDGLVCDDVCWWSRFNKGDDIVYVIVVWLRNIVEGKGSNN